MPRNYIKVFGERDVRLVEDRLRDNLGVSETREHVAFIVARKLDAASVIELLDLACLEHGGRPRVIRMDNGPEFISHALQEWATEDRTIQAFIPPGQPWHNGFVESFHNRMRDELLEDNSIENLEHARLLVDL